MRPGAFSRTGFLGPTERLREVLETDAAVLRKLNVTCAEIAQKLETLVAAAEASPDGEARVGTLQCRVQVHQGFQICPWASDPRRAQCSAGLGVRHASADWRIVNLKTGGEMSGPGLAVHLIRDHNFFEGPTAPHRVDPSRLASLLGLCGGSDSAP